MKKPLANNVVPDSAYEELNDAFYKAAADVVWNIPLAGLNHPYSNIGEARTVGDMCDPDTHRTLNSFELKSPAGAGEDNGFFNKVFQAAQGPARDYWRYRVPNHDRYASQYVGWTPATEEKLETDFADLRKLLPPAVFEQVKRNLFNTIDKAIAKVAGPQLD